MCQDTCASNPDPTSTRAILPTRLRRSTLEFAVTTMELTSATTRGRVVARLTSGAAALMDGLGTTVQLVSSRCKTQITNRIFDVIHVFFSASADPCASDACSGHGSCYVTSDLAANCTCDDGYEGESCEVAQCSEFETYCENGGTCP